VGRHGNHGKNHPCATFLLPPLGTLTILHTTATATATTTTTHTHTHTHTHKQTTTRMATNGINENQFNAREIVFNDELWIFFHEGRMNGLTVENFNKKDDGGWIIDDAFKKFNPGKEFYELFVAWANACEKEDWNASKEAKQAFMMYFRHHMKMCEAREKHKKLVNKQVQDHLSHRCEAYVGIAT
jgi:hypothetical protein